MARLIYASAALADLVEIAAYIAETSGSSDLASDYLARLREKCRELADLPFPVGRYRPEFGLELRSYAFGSHVVFFRADRDTFMIIAVVEGHRDISAFLLGRT